MDFTSVVINNGFNDFVVTTNEGPGQTGSISNVPIFAGVLNTITVMGTTHGQATYGGSATFVPDAIPEASTWAMMMIGFGGIGGTIRYRRRKSVAAPPNSRTIAYT